MKRRLKVNFVEGIAATMLIGVYSLLFLPLVYYFEAVHLYHIVAFTAGLVVLNVLFGSFRAWWKHRNTYMPRDNAEWLYETVEELAEEIGTKTPRIVVLESDIPNAYATDILPLRPIITVSTGLLEQLDAEERQAVLAHEIAHINHHDVYFMLSLSSFVNLIEKLHTFVRSQITSSNADDDNGAEALMFLPFYIITYINLLIVHIIIFFISRVREYSADRKSAETVSPTAMADALKKIDESVEQNKTKSREVFANRNALTIIPVGKIESRLFKTHPSTESRIERVKAVESQQVVEETVAEKAEESDDRSAQEQDDKTEGSEEVDEEQSVEAQSEDSQTREQEDAEESEEQESTSGDDIAENEEEDEESDEESDEDEGLTPITESTSDDAEDDVAFPTDVSLRSE